MTKITQLTTTKGTKVTIRVSATAKGWRGAYRFFPCIDWNPLDGHFSSAGLARAMTVAAVELIDFGPNFR
jgi:hypothetical protein